MRKIIGTQGCIFVMLALLCSCRGKYSNTLAGFVELSGDISKDIQLNASTQYLLTGQVFVQPGVTLRIEAGTVIKATPLDSLGAAAALIVKPGAKIIAEGTQDNPITFTSALDQSLLPLRGTWGGLVILGKAPVNQSEDKRFIEGVVGVRFGGTDVADNSGVLKYVRVWYGGRDIGEGNKLNGITFGGVGNGTIVEHCEVAWNADDGFEFFGGTVNVKYLSSIYNGDDSFDFDWGYQGRGQFLFSLSGRDVAGRALEIDNDGDSPDLQPRSYPIISHATLIGPGGGKPEGDANDRMMYLREGTGGDFRNVVAVNGNGEGINVNGDSSKKIITQSSSQSIVPNALYLSSRNIFFSMAKGPVASGNTSAISVSLDDPALTQISLNDLSANKIDPRPRSTSSILTSGESTFDLNFFEAVNYSGAFSQTNLWLEKWSWLDSAGQLVKP